MKSKYVFISIAVVITCGLFALFLSLPLIGCNGEPHCCPRIAVDSVLYPSVVCHPDCPGGGEIEVMGTLTFEKGQELCEPAEFRVYIHNLTTGEDLPPLVIDKGKPGVYGYKEKIKLDSDTEFELRAVGDKECAVARQKFKVRVIRPGEIERHELIFTEQKAYSTNIEWTRNILFGYGIHVDKVANENPFTVDVDHNILHLQLPKQGDQGYTHLVAHQDKIPADGPWTVRIPSESVYKQYSDLGKPPIKIIIDVTVWVPINLNTVE